MQFKQPEILYFLALLIIPIIVHLFQLQRFVKVPFTNVAFLQKLALQTRKSSQLKKWLILCTRLLGFLAIFLAFSQPYFSLKNSLKKQNNFIYLDNSLSLDSKGEKGNLFKVAAQEIIDNIPDKEIYSLATNTDYYSNLSSSELKKVVLNTVTSSKKANLNDIILKISSKNKNSTNNLSNNILISDFQNINKPNFTNVNTVFSLTKLQNTLNNNLSIDSLYITNNNGLNFSLNVVVQNQGKAKNNIPIALFNDTNLINKLSFSIENNSKKTIQFAIQNPYNFKGEIKITFSDTFSFDNNFFFYLNTPQKTNVLSIGNDSDFLSKIYTKREFSYTNNSVQKINYNNIVNQQLIILNELTEIPNSLKTSLIDFSKKGGDIVIIPNKDSNLNSYNSLLSELNNGKIISKKNINLKITQVNYNHPFFKNVFSKKVTNFQYPETKTIFESSFRNSSNISSFEDNSSFIKEIPLNNSKLYLFSSPLEKDISNFVNSPLVVPVFYNFAKLSLQHSQLYYRIDNKNTIDVYAKLNKDEILSISNGKSTFIPLQQNHQNKVTITTKEQPLEAGFYHIINKKDTLKTIAFNNSTEESSLNFLDTSELKDYKNISISNSVEVFFKENNEKNKVTWLWKWFLALAIVSLLLEILILKFLKP